MRNSFLLVLTVVAVFFLGTSNAGAGNGPVFDYCDCVADCDGDVTTVEFRASVHNPPYCMDVGPIYTTISGPATETLTLDEPFPDAGVCPDRPANFSTTRTGLPSGDYTFVCEGGWWDGTNAGDIPTVSGDCSIPECDFSCEASFPGCGGECPEGEECVDGPDTSCVCEPVLVACETSSFPECGGECPPGQVCVIGSGESCVCEPVGSCGASSFPECGGECFPGDECVSDSSTGVCRCETIVIPCEGTFPACGGPCPEGKECVEGGGMSCVCELVDPCEAVDCSSLDDQCNDGACNSDTGECFAEPKPAGTACGNPTDYVCNNPDTCDGAGVCEDNLEPNGFPCPDIALECLDAACMNGTCEQEFAPAPAGTPCGSRTDYVCNNPDTCDGAGVCEDNLEPNGFPCPDIALECLDAACMSGTCKQDFAPTPAGTACGDPADTDCDNPDGCDGAGACASNYEPAGTDCSDSVFCNGAETCEGTSGDCLASIDPCLVDETCDEAADLCSAPCDFDPRTQGYWYRQCLGLPISEGGLDPGRQGRGPSKIKESDFRDELIPCANQLLEDLGFFSYQTCLDGMDAEPPADPCERAINQMTALILNVCSDRLYDTCELDLSNVSCSAISVGGLLYELAGLIIAGDCGVAADCAALVNEGEGLVYDNEF